MKDMLDVHCMCGHTILTVQNKKEFNERLLRNSRGLIKCNVCGHENTKEDITLVRTTEEI